jgi:hypothetical protein
MQTLMLVVLLVTLLFAARWHDQPAHKREQVQNSDKLK